MGRPYLERAKEPLSGALILLVWSVVSLPRLLQTFTTTKFRGTVAEQVPSSHLAALVERLLSVGTLGLCLFVIAIGLGDLPSTKRRSLVLLLAPWVYLVIRDLYLGRVPQRLSQVLYPALVLAIWVLRPRLRSLFTLGYLTGLTALLSISIALALPDKGLYRSVAGGLVAPDKEILPFGIVIGFFTDGNNLGQALLLGLPTVLLLPRRFTRWVLFTLTAVTVVATSSRSSIVGVAVVGCGSVLLRPAAPAVRAAVSRLILLTLGTAVVLLPVLTHDVGAFTNRGNIWRYSLEQWASDPIFGLGWAWYSSIAQYVNPLGPYAFHGHNQLVQTLVAGGLINLLLVGLLLLNASARAARWAARDQRMPTLFLAALLTSGLLEVPFGLLDRSFLQAVVYLPLTFLVFAAETPETAEVLPHGEQESPLAHGGTAPPGQERRGRTGWDDLRRHVPVLDPVDACAPGGSVVVR